MTTPRSQDADALRNTEQGGGENPIYTEFKAWWQSVGAEKQKEARDIAALTGANPNKELK